MDERLDDGQCAALNSGHVVHMKLCESGLRASEESDKQMKGDDYLCVHVIESDNCCIRMQNRDVR